MITSKIQKYLRNPSKYNIYQLVSNKCFHKISNLYHFPGIFPETILGKLFPKMKRAKYYEKLFSYYPHASLIIKNHTNTHTLSKSNEDKEPSVPNVCHQGRNINFVPLLEEGILLIPNAISKADHRTFCEEINKNWQDLITASFSYDRNTYHHLFDKNMVNSPNLLELNVLLKNINHTLFRKNSVPYHSFSAITSNGVDTLDPNSIPHVDRFVPCLKAFYYPFEVNDSGSPFQYAKKSHIIDESFNNAFEEAYLMYQRGKSKPFEMPKWYMDQFQITDMTVESNTLLLAFTNGIHSRKPFCRSPAQRLLIQYNWYSDLTKFDNLLPFVIELLNLDHK